MANDGKPTRQRLTLIRIFEGPRGRGSEGLYDVVRRYARSWRRERFGIIRMHDAYYVAKSTFCAPFCCIFVPVPFIISPRVLTGAIKYA